MEPRDLRAEILAQAARLFIQHGYHGLSMRTIAEAVGVSKAALYYHFRDKEELFLAILQENLDQTAALIDRVTAEYTSAGEQIRALATEILQQPVAQRAVIRLASQELVQLSTPARQAFQQQYQEKFIGRIRAVLAAGIERGELRPLDPEIATWTLLGMMYPYFYPVQAISMPPANEALQQMLQIYLQGALAER